ncbi:MAG: RidA family protein [Cytophagales bacterium]|nr:RidA family protein [Bernardetiaceae bacterium]MDW8205329.1 RidA family protein [Cytophagales bacterium]
MRKVILLPLFWWLLVACKQPSLHMVQRYDNNPASPILQGVEIPAGKRWIHTSGIVAAIADSSAAPGSRQRFGDTYTQSISIIKRIEGILKQGGMSLSNVVFLRVYVAPDPQKGNQPDYNGWFEAYKLFFNNPQNPVKVARSTLGVQSLVTPDYLIEIEAIAVEQ